MKPPKALSVSFAESGTAPREFRIFHAGVNTSTKGPSIFDKKAAGAVMDYFAQRGLTLKMDYEHQSINTVKNGQPAPNSAKAWTPAIRFNDAGEPELWATDIDWTDRARQMIEAGEYSYFSPLFQTDDDERVTAVLNLALTNLPALDNIDELIAASMAPTALRARTDRLIPTSQVAMMTAMGFDDGKQKRFSSYIETKGKLTMLTQEERSMWNRLPASLQRQADEMGFDDAKKARFAADFAANLASAKEKKLVGLTMTPGEALALSVATHAAR